MRNTLRALSCVAVVVSVAASCGESTSPADTTAVASTLPSDVPTSLTITVGTAGEPALATATLEIAADGTASGTGFLAAPQRAADAAVLLENPAAVKRLKEGPPPGQACTEIYGGPDTATVRGTFQGGAVEQEFHRSNGCGISDWELFVPLLGRSRWDGEHRVYFREESSIPVAVGTMFTIELDSNATTGYQWQMLPLDGKRFLDIRGIRKPVVLDEQVDQIRPTENHQADRKKWKQERISKPFPGSGQKRVEE